MDPAQSDFESGKKFLQEASYGQAANAFHNALLGFEQTNNEQGIANANDKLGDICRERQEFEKALRYYQGSQEICEHLKDTPSVLALLKKKAFCHRSLGQLSETLSLSFQLLDIYTDWQNPALSVEILSDIAGLFTEMGEREKAADTYKTAAAIHRNYGHTIIAQELLDKADTVLAG
ncbi:MAG: hypothetical protein A2511_16705 [Deltaproteobacteria bacterium RIFOXYD12_FULL_50_9]|nr:MAG: hypothetical protein A2511_16705 [Deltaproteobacteria bacterium RIFOXYD12_FULL_50_9]